jgi:PAS domain S-box-containing protein
MNVSVDSLSDLVVERVGFGIFVLDREMNVLMWNRFMQDHSGLSPEQVVGKSLFTHFPVQFVGAAPVSLQVRSRPADYRRRRFHAAGLHVHAADA